MNRKGSVVKDIPPEALIAILVVIVIGIVFVMFISGVNIYDGTCRVKSSVLSLSPSGGAKVAISGLTSCSPISEKVDGNDWSKCSEEQKIAYDKYSDSDHKLEAQRECAAYQLAKLAERCWFMHNSGSFAGPSMNIGECNNYPCFSIQVLDTGQQVDLVARAKKYTKILQGDGADRLYVDGSTGCTSKSYIDMYYVDDYNPQKDIYTPRTQNYDSMCIKC